MPLAMAWTYIIATWSIHSPPLPCDYSDPIILSEFEILHNKIQCTD